MDNYNPVGNEVARLQAHGEMGTAVYFMPAEERRFKRKIVIYTI
jgi:MOSC domain-containing protein YiiM